MNNILKNQLGVSLVAVVIITGIVTIGGFAIYKWTASVTTEDKMMESDVDTMMEKSSSPTPDSMMKDEKMMPTSSPSGKDNSMMDNGTMMKLDFSGQVLAGTKSPLFDFNKADYDKAVASGKLVALYFYANWCPICKAEFPKMQEAFNRITDDKVIGFRVNYNDDQTDNDEKELARGFGVAYQHTKVFVKNGQRILKAPESWNSADTYISKINEYK